MVSGNSNSLSKTYRCKASNEVIDLAEYFSLKRHATCYVERILGLANAVTLAIPDCM